MKVKDYFGVHQITEKGDKINRFKDALFEAARKWAQTLNYTEVTKFDYDPANAGDKEGSMKCPFLARFAKEGRNLEAAYSAWGALTFDPNKDDIEQFILKVEELAKKLGYNYYYYCCLFHIYTYITIVIYSSHIIHVYMGDVV